MNMLPPGHQSFFSSYQLICTAPLYGSQVEWISSKMRQPQRWWCWNYHARSAAWGILNVHAYSRLGNCN